MISPSWIPGIAMSTIAAGTATVAQQVVNGAEPPTLTTGLVFMAGVAAIGTLWRSWRKDQAEAVAQRREYEADAAAMRRADDLIRERELVRLRKRVDRLVDQLVENGVRPVPADDDD